MVELLVVITIIAILTGITAAGLSRVGRSLAVSAFRGQVSAMVRTARNAAVQNDAPAVVEVEFGDQEDGGGELRIITNKVMGMWQFEPGYEDEGAGGIDLTFNGKTEPVPGRFGAGLRLAARAYLTTDTSARFDLINGGTISAWVMPEEQKGGTIIRRGKGWRLSLDDEGIVTAQVAYRSREECESTRPLLFNRWNHVEMQFDLDGIKILINGAECGTWEPTAEERPLRIVPDEGAGITIGSKRNGLRGRIDHVRVADFDVEERETVPKGVAFDQAGTIAQRITFLPSGRLDPRLHDRTEVITLRSTRTKKLETVRIGLEGGIR
jgi:type II secretory pathway pseudopilin PulG